MMRWVLCGVTLAACYRDTGAPIANEPGAAPLVMVTTAPTKCRTDDRTQPVFDKPGGRLRTHTDGPLSGTGRSWGGPQVPPDVPTRLDTLELFIADEADGGTLAFYREPYDLKSCRLSGSTNCAYEARFYDGGGLAWSLKLNDVLSMRSHLEIQDIRLAGGVLYFNEACQSYSKEAGGKCSRLVAVDPARAKVLWRTDPLTSNGRFRVAGCYIIAGYGFTAEPDAMFVVDRASGKVQQSFPVSSSPEEFRITGKDQLDVTLYTGVERHYRMDGFDSPAAKLVSLDAPEPIFGGAGYGGTTYGGKRRP